MRWALFCLVVIVYMLYELHEVTIRIAASY